MPKGKSPPKHARPEEAGSEPRIGAAHSDLQRRFKFIDVQDPNVRRRGRTRTNEPPRQESFSSKDAVVPKSIMFVDVNDPESRREARSHVQREAKGHREEFAQETVVSDIDMNLHTNWQRLGLHLAEDVLNQGLSSIRHLQAPPSADPIDPFNNFPIDLDYPRQELINHFITLSTRWLAHFHTESFYNPVRDAVIPVGMAHPAGIHIILSYSAYSMALVKGEKEPVDALQHKAKAFSLINEALQDPAQRLSDGILSAVVAAVWLEHRWGTHASLMTHLDGLNQMLQSRGGPRSLRANRSLDLTVSWHEILTGHEQAQRLRSQGGGGSPQSPGSRGTNVWHYLGILTSLLENLNVWIRLTQDTTPSGANFQQIRFINARREETFGRKRPLYHILSSPPGVYLQTGGQVAAASESCRIACLIYLNLVLWEYRDSPESYAAFLHKLNAIFFHNHLDRTRGIEALTWILIKDIDDQPARKWDVLQLMVIVELLSPETKSLVTNFLLDNLSSEVDEELETLTSEEIELIRTEVTDSLPGRAPWEDEFPFRR